MQKTDFNRDWTVQKDGSNEILHVNLPDDAMIREAVSYTHLDVYKRQTYSDPSHQLPPSAHKS